MTPEPRIDPAALWLCQLPGMSAALACELLRARGSAMDVMHTSSRLLRELGVPPGLVSQIVAGPRQLPHVAAGIKGLQRLGIEPIPLAGSAYPERLRELDPPPLVVYVQGTWPIATPLLFLARPPELAPTIAAQWADLIRAVQPHVAVATVRLDLAPDSPLPRVLAVPYGLMVARQRLPQPVWNHVRAGSLTLLSIVPPTAQSDPHGGLGLTATLLRLSRVLVMIAPMPTGEAQPLIAAARQVGTRAFVFGMAAREPLPDGARRLRGGQPGVRAIHAALGIGVAEGSTVQQERLF